MLTVADKLQSASYTLTEDSQSPDSAKARTEFEELMNRSVGFTRQDFFPRAIADANDNDADTRWDSNSQFKGHAADRPAAETQAPRSFNDPVETANDPNQRFQDPKSKAAPADDHSNEQARTLRGAIKGMDISGPAPTDPYERRATEAEQTLARAISGLNNPRERFDAPFRQEKAPADLRPEIQNPRSATVALPVEEQMPPALAAVVRLRRPQHGLDERLGLDQRWSQNQATQESFKVGHALGAATGKMDAALAYASPKYGEERVQRIYEIQKSLIQKSRDVDPGSTDFQKNLSETARALTGLDKNPRIPDYRDREVWNLLWGALTGMGDVAKKATITPDLQATLKDLDRKLPGADQGGNAFFTLLKGIHADNRQAQGPEQAGPQGQITTSPGMGGA